MTQLDLGLGPAKRARRAKAPRRSIDERFRDWLDANPTVYPTIVGLARQAKAAGKTAIGMKAIWEVARWTLSLSTEGDDYRWNNDFTAPMARLIQQQEPDLAGLFETRKRRAA